MIPIKTKIFLELQTENYEVINMKKRKVNIAIITSLLALSLTACGEPIVEDSNISTLPAIDSYPVYIESEPDNTEETEVIDESSSNKNDDVEEVPNPDLNNGEGLEYDENPDDSPERQKIKSAITTVINDDNHTYMEEVTNKEILSEYFLINSDDEKIEESVVYQCPMSAVMSEIIVLKSSDVDYVKNILEQRKDKAINQDAFYPEDVENAAASIVGTTGNYAYFIISSTSTEDEEALVNLLSEE